MPAGALIDGRLVQTGAEPWVVAEISCNHMGSLQTARTLIQAAAWAGADAVKFQLYTPSDMARPDTMLTSGPWAGRTLYDLYAEAMTPREWFPELFTLARTVGLVPFTAVFNPEDIPFLEDLDSPVYKVASAEIGWTELVTALAKTGKPLIISTGMATGPEIVEAVAAARPAPVILLHCVAAYPTPVEAASLSRLRALRAYDVDAVGVSDHSVGSDLVPVAATAMGAAVIEKHIMLHNTKPLDAKHSLTSGQFKRMVDAVRQTWKACQPGPDVEVDSRQFKRRLIDGKWLRG